MGMLSEQIRRFLRESPMSFNQLKRVLGVHQQSLVNEIRRMKEDEIRLTPLVDVGRKKAQIVYDLKLPSKASLQRRHGEIVDSKLPTVRVTDQPERLLAVWPGLGTITEWLQGSYLHIEGYRGNKTAHGSVPLMQSQFQEGREDEQDCL